MIKYIILAPMLLLSGCYAAATPEEIEAHKRQVEANKVQACKDMGAPKGSKNYYNCRKDLQDRQLVKQISDDNFERQRLEGVQRRLEQDQRQNASPPPAWLFGNTTRCRSYAAGNDINTDCS